MYTSLQIFPCTSPYLVFYSPTRADPLLHPSHHTAGDRNVVYQHPAADSYVIEKRAEHLSGDSRGGVAGDDPVP